MPSLPCLCAERPAHFGHHLAPGVRWWQGHMQCWAVLTDRRGTWPYAGVVSNTAAGWVVFHYRHLWSHPLLRLLTHCIAVL